MVTNILLPIAGNAKRFVDRGYKLPKPLLPANGVPMIQLAINSLFTEPSDKYRLIFVVREDHVVNHDIVNALKYLFKDWQTDFVILNAVTQGTLCSCMTAEHLIDNDEPLVIYTPDVCFDRNFDIEEHFLKEVYDGLLVTFKANSPDHSYVSLGPDGFATETAEKRVISSDAAVGVYCWRSGKMFMKYAREMVDGEHRVNNEFYVAPTYNLLIRDKLMIGAHRIDKMYVLGTPEDLDFYESHVARYGKIGTVVICADHSGFELKQHCINYLREMKIPHIDFGAYSMGDSDHADFLKPCIEYLNNNKQTVGMAFCATGQGFNIAANKAVGIRSALIHDEYSAEFGRRHNAANFFCVPSRTVNPELLPGMISAIVNNSFDGGRHSTRIQKFERDDAAFRK